MEEYDEIYDEALEFVAQKGQTSTSMIQRRFKIGYHRAADIIEVMEREGIIGPTDGSKPREVLIPAPTTKIKKGNIFKPTEYNFETKEDKRKLAFNKTDKAETVIKGIENTLQNSLDVNNKIDWDSLSNKAKYFENKPQKPKEPEPKISEPKFNPKLGLISYLFPPLKKKKINEADQFFEQEHKKWEKTLAGWNLMLLTWEEKAKEYIEKREKIILKKKELYFTRDACAIIDYGEMVLTNSKYPDTFPKQYDLVYKPDTKILIVDYFLPSKECIPTLKEVKYVALHDKYKEIHISEIAFNKLYDSLLYQITLRTIHELYDADVIKVFDLIVFNGFVKFIDKETGREVTSCILSVEAKREEFLGFNLANVDPKSCFKRLRGVGSSKLHGLVPIAPIMKINKEDKRFILPYDVIESVDERTNIAAMDWQDFENLIREVFEKEFASVGGEVKITQTSRDRGVDAIVFDTDPIRGGKIVIQAKRYTNTVGVSAVRDLYGTVVNEGALKGILVTTADYGPDSYEFAKDKPITLINGSNLLHLLEKYGHEAKIDLKEAKKLLEENKSE